MSYPNGAMEIAFQMALEQTMYRIFQRMMWEANRGRT